MLPGFIVNFPKKKDKQINKRKKESKKKNNKQMLVSYKWHDSMPTTQDFGTFSHDVAQLIMIYFIIQGSECLKTYRLNKTNLKTTEHVQLWKHRSTNTFNNSAIIFSR